MLKFEEKERVPKQKQRRNVIRCKIIEFDSERADKCVRKQIHTSY